MLKKKMNENSLIAGMDEAGRGSLLSRVYTAIVVLPDNFKELCKEENVIIRDSKKMTKRQRDRSRLFIEEHAIDYNVQFVEHDTIDKIGILNATFLSMNHCVDGLHVVIDKLLVDGDCYQNHRKDIPHECVIRGDDQVMEIACASILAKTYRDEYVTQLYHDHSDLLGKYGIQTNMGYGTKVHMDAIQQFGFTSYHRKSFCRSSFSFFKK